MIEPKILSNKRVLAPVLRGPGKLPQVAAQIGKYLAQFQRAPKQWNSYGLRCFTRMESETRIPLLWREQELQHRRDARGPRRLAVLGVRHFEIAKIVALHPALLHQREV